MEAKELMNNDLVVYGGHWCRFVIRPMDAIVLRISDKSEYPPCAVSNAEPIPLTEEILKANGFRQVNTWMYKRVRECGTFDVCIDLRYDEIEISKISGVGTDCEECDYDSRISLGHTPSVHELQHALRLCGLNKLADNFNV